LSGEPTKTRKLTPELQNASTSSRHQQSANRVMIEVPSLFELDKDNAADLSVRKIHLPD
jgi:hypothetical protein